MRKILTIAAIIAMLAAPISDIYAKEITGIITPASISIDETIKSGQKQAIQELKRKLLNKFDYHTIDSIFNNPEFKIEKGVMNNWKGCKADSGERIIIHNYGDYRNALEIEKIFELKSGFMKEYDDVLSAAEKMYNVDKKYITGILGIETKFGNNLGRYKTVNALVSTYVLIEKKRKFALAHLTELIEYSKKTNVPLFSFKGSYAGATSIAQFMPWSLNREYVGESGDIAKSHPYNMRDAIFSAAYYLNKRGFAKNSDQAILRYNKSKMYVRAVKEIALFDRK